MEPMVLGRLLQAAAPQPGDMALDIGCATGYSTAVLAQLVQTVVGLECDRTLMDSANRTLNALDVDNAVVVEGPPEHGYQNPATYNVNCSQAPGWAVTEATQPT